MDPKSARTNRNGDASRRDPDGLETVVDGTLEATLAVPL